MSAHLQLQSRELQRRSKWKEKYSIYLGVYFKDYDMSGYPQVHKSHFNFHIDEICIENDTEKYKDEYLNLNSNMDNNTRIIILNQRFDKLNLIFPYLETKKTLLQLLEKYPNLKYMLSADAINALNL